jgi:uncharacterized protein
MITRFMQAIHGAVRLATVAAALAISSPAAYAQQPPAATIASATELIKVTGATTLFNPLIAGVIEQAKSLYLQQNPGLAKDLNEIGANLRTEFSPRFSQLNDEVAKIYATRFTDQEIKDMLAFYKSPTGQKMLSEQPKVVEASIKFAQNWSNKLSDEVVVRMRDELKKRGRAQ